MLTSLPEAEADELAFSAHQEEANPEAMVYFKNAFVFIALKSMFKLISLLF